MYSSGRNTSYYGALEEYIWWIVILIVVEVVLLWTKYYYASPVAGIIALAFMIVGVISTSNISNVEIYDELLLTLDFIPISLCIVGDFWLIVKCRAEKTVLTKNETTSSAQAIKEYKELLDQGIISQEEYDKKKKQLLER
jgi:membrane-bound ClpP family serine protease